MSSFHSQLQTFDTMYGILGIVVCIFKRTGSIESKSKYDGSLNLERYRIR